MKYLLFFAGALALCILSFAGALYWKYTQLFPAPSNEVVQLTPEKRAVLDRLRAETKFQPHHFPPLGYTGAETQEERVRATDAVLAQTDGPVQARDVSRLIGKGLSQVSQLATEDRDRTGDYLLEVWYILGFKGATGRFATGVAYSRWLQRTASSGLDGPGSATSDRTVTTVLP